MISEHTRRLADISIDACLKIVKEYADMPQRTISEVVLLSLIAVDMKALKNLTASNVGSIEIQLPTDARSPWIERGNELYYNLVGTMSADSDSQKLPDGQWKIVNLDINNLLTVERV